VAGDGYLHAEVITGDSYRILMMDPATTKLEPGWRRYMRPSDLRIDMKSDPDLSVVNTSTLEDLAL